MIPIHSKAVIFSVAGAEVSEAEAAFFKEARPVGFILFARNCESPQQLKALTDDLREAVGWRCPILIDQEGGRVQRMKPPHWRQFPPMKQFGDLARTDLEKAKEDLRFAILQMAEPLLAAGVNVNCAPVMDVLTTQTHDAIGDRAFSDDPDIVKALGQVVCETFLAAGIVPVIKHLPGHGRAVCDSHKDLPCVDADIAALDKIDFDAFRIENINTVWGMVAHIVYAAIDADHPASVSPVIIQDIIRKGIGFGGFLVSDDLDMEALAGYGDIAARARLSIEAGCDAALYCAGDLDVMRKVANSVPKLGEKARARLQKLLPSAIIGI